MAATGLALFGADKSQAGGTRLMHCAALLRLPCAADDHDHKFSQMLFMKFDIGFLIKV